MAGSAGPVAMFAGPTLARARRIAPDLALPGVQVLPPAGRGDVARLAARGDVAQLAARIRAGTIILVDGVFHDRLAVGHAELRDAAAAGWTVWGLSSMGAIRAREMSHLGVRGFGEVFELFAAPGRDVRDDEVTLLHGPGPDYVEITEPLVHLRRALAAFTARGLLPAAAAAAIADDLAGRYFGERDLGRFRELVLGAAPAPFDPLAGFDAHRVKCHDLIRFARQVLAPA